MRVLFITGQFYPDRCGITDYIICLSNALSTLGLDVHILTKEDAEVVEGSFTVHPIVEHWTRRSLALIRKLVVDLLPDIMHIQYETFGFECCGFINRLPLFLKGDADFGNMKIITTLHDTNGPFPVPTPFRTMSAIVAGKLGLSKLSLRYLLNHSDRVIVTNEPHRHEVADIQFVKNAVKENIVQIPIGSNIPVVPLDAHQCKQLRARFGLAESDVLISYFGLIKRNKGLENLFVALKHVLPTQPRMKLLIMGHIRAEDQNYCQRLRKILGELNIEDRVVWTYQLSNEEISTLLQMSLIYVLPLRDGVSLARTTLITPLIHGVPIISTRHRTTPQMLKDHENIILVPPENPAALAKAIAELACSPELVDLLRRNIVQLAPKFSWERIAQQTLAAYQNVQGMNRNSNEDFKSK